MDFPDHPFWDFSLETYAQPGVAPACLALQERHRIDVNLLLFCCWLGRAGYGSLGDAGIARLAERAAPWHRDVVRGLRALRAHLKHEIPGSPEDLRLALRKRVAALEIDAEHVEQLALADALAEIPSGMPGGIPTPETEQEAGVDDAVANLSSYFSFCGIVADAADRDGLATILDAAFPDVPATRIGQLCGSFGGHSDNSGRK